MEVHHHPHIKKQSTGHAGKRFKEHFLEFLMLFLAVFLGFLAENIREHQVEKEKGKQYIRSFYEDLKTDTARISFNIAFDESKIEILENLKSCYDSISQNFRGSECMLDIIKFTAINRPFKMTERTINQLASAGGFRLLEKDDADSIIAYQKAYENFQDFQQTVFQEAQDNVRNTYNKLISFEANKQMFNPDGARLMSTKFENNDITAPLFFSNDKSLLNQYFNELLLYYRCTYNHKGMLLNLKDEQTRLITFLKNKDHFN